MKIALYDQFVHGHHLKYASELHKQLLIEGDEIIFLTEDTENKRYFDDFKDLYDNTIFVDDFKNALECADKHNVDVFHILYYSNYGPFTAFLQYRPKFKIYLSVFWLNFLFGYGDNSFTSFKEVAVNYCFLMFLHFTGVLSGLFIHSVSPDYSKEIINSKHLFKSIFEKKILYLYDPTYDFVANECPQIESKEILDLDSNEDYYLLFGLLTKNKGIIELLNHLDLYTSSNKILIVGGESSVSGDDICHILKEKSIEHKVIARPYRIPDDLMYHYFNAADAILLPYTISYRYGTSGLVTQSCLLQKPLISTDVGSIGHAIKKYGIGYVPNDSNYESYVSEMNNFSKVDDVQSIKEKCIDYSQMTRCELIFNEIRSYYRDNL